MTQPPDPERPPEPPAQTNSDASDGPLRTYAEALGVNFDAVVESARRWVAENPLPPDLGPEPFNVGKPRPPVDVE